MAVNKYFLDNQPYGVGAFNKIVSSLRTTGVLGTGLAVSAGSGLTVEIDNGIGFVEGVAIEVTVDGTSLTLPGNGSYSIIMELQETDDIVNDIRFWYASGPITADYVLAWVTVSSGVITAVTDKRKTSNFLGATVLNQSSANGYFDDTTTVIPAFSVHTITIDMGIEANRGRLMLKSTFDGQTLAEIDNDENFRTGAVAHFDKVKDHTMCEVFNYYRTYLSTGDSNNLAYSFGNGICLQAVYISGTNLIVEFKNLKNAPNTMGLKSALWEVEV